MRSRAGATRPVRRVACSRTSSGRSTATAARPGRPRRRPSCTGSNRRRTLGDADYEYRKADPRAAFDTAREIADSFQERRGDHPGPYRPHTSADEADLVVEVAACRSAKSFPTQSKPDRCYVLFSLGAGGRMDPKQFSKVPADYPVKKIGTRAWRVAGPTADRPVFHFESYNWGRQGVRVFRTRPPTPPPPPWTSSSRTTTAC